MQILKECPYVSPRPDFHHVHNPLELVQNLTHVGYPFSSLHTSKPDLRFKKCRMGDAASHRQPLGAGQAHWEQCRLAGSASKVTLYFLCLRGQALYELLGHCPQYHLSKKETVMLWKAAPWRQINWNSPFPDILHEAWSSWGIALGLVFLVKFPLCLSWLCIYDSPSPCFSL